MKATPEECKVELAAKLLEDYKYIYNYNIELVDSTSAWRKEKEGFVKDLTNAKNEIAKLKQDKQNIIDIFMNAGVITVITILGAALLCLL